MRFYAGASACALALGLAGCGSADEEKPAAAKPMAQATKLTVVAPANNATVRTATVAVRGTVAPADARVLVTGKTAQIADGVFSATIPITVGENSIDVVATAPGAEPVTRTLTVTRGRTQAQLNAAVTAKNKRKARAAAARKARAARAAAKAEASPQPSQGSAGCITVPNVVGKDHQLAQDTMQSAGLYSLDEEDATGQGRTLLFDRNWTTVSQDPAAGACVSEDTTVTLSAKKDGE